MRIPLGLLVGCLMLSTLASAQPPTPPLQICDETTSTPGPSITAEYNVEGWYDWHPPDGPYRDYRGIVVEENDVQEYYPLVMSVFFELGSPAITYHYAQLASQHEADAFADSTLAGGGLAKQSHVLNLIGSRLRSHPPTSISLIPIVAIRAKSPAERELATERARRVRDYLMRVWGIASARVALSSPQTSQVPMQDQWD